MRRLLLLFVLMPGVALANSPRVVGIEAMSQDGTWRFDVAVEHADEGWDHYADAWQILGADDTVLGTRELVHPHVDEQPFTRSLSSVMIPDGANKVIIRARCSKSGWGADEYILYLD